MKKVYIIGAGVNAQSITGEGKAAISAAGVLFGAPRLLAVYEGAKKPSFPFYQPDQVLSEIARSDRDVFAVLVSGDVGFFSGAAALCEALSDFDIRLIPGISCVNMFAARLKIPWQDFKLVSMHGMGANIAEAVRRNRRVLCLTGKNAAQIGQTLCDCGLGDVQIYVGENLGAQDEKITEMTASGLSTSAPDPLTTLFIVNENFDGRVRSGLPDQGFSRFEGVPMTKSEIRAVVLSKLGLSPGDVCYDIGAGTGSVTVEMALAAYNGHVFALEQNEKALPLIRENLTRFQIGNGTVLHGRAPEVFAALPAPDAAFIGGSSGEIAGIIDALVKKNPSVRIVVTAIAVESAAAALRALESVFSGVELVQISVARAKPAGGLHLMTAQNPVTIISGGGR